MKLFFDTSSLLKHYISEEGSELVDKLFMESERIYVSEITSIESYSALNRLVKEKAITSNQMNQIFSELNYDFSYFSIVDMKDSKDLAISLIGKYKIKTLDAIQLGSALIAKNEIDHFVCSDKQLIRVGKMEGQSILVVP